eukprot:TRINITY_DN438_c0_g1_i2.p1 TRINITY_DN438_c0_g1~~TRINITY_DN438_c0_g1_i2.p1  ORF type:complete len:465 (+),score=152.89 TRINITY_DN438_c0_g1_i2:122-1516(+)
MLAGAALLATVQAGLQSVPPPECAAQMNAWCTDQLNCPVRLSPGATMRYALDDLPAARQWRCYDPSTLNADHTAYVSGKNYCSRDAELKACLAACQAGKPCTNTTPAPQPPSRPAPPNPTPVGNLTSTVVFWPYDMAVPDGDVYPCIRIPSILLAGGKVLLAFAECRRTLGDGCNPDGGHNLPGARRDVCMKSSTNGGAEWSSLSIVARACLQPDPVWDERTGAVVLNMNCDGLGVAQSISTDLGKSWTQVVRIDAAFGAAAGSAVGPGVGLQLSAKNPHHPGRMLHIAHHGAYVADYVWYSDDDGKTYQVANTSFAGMDEAQLVELSNGDVLANMRNSHKTSCDCRGISRSTDGGSTWGPVTYDAALISPVCQASILRVGGAIYFSNPATKKGRTTGLVRRSDDDTKTWPRALPITGSSQDFAYSCLTQVPQPASLGLLWETNCAGCSGESCCSAFSVLPQQF